MRLLYSLDPFGYGAVAAGVSALWVLLAADIAPSTLAAAGAVAIAATAWSPSIQP